MRHQIPGHARAASTLVTVLVTLAASVAVALAGAVTVVPRLAGGQVYTVLSGSMEPALPFGSAVVTRAVDPAEVTVGDIIAFTDRDRATGAEHTVTHRVVEVGPGPVFRTRGDANAAPDVDPVAARDVLGRHWYVLPWVGSLARFVRTGPGLAVSGGVLLLVVAGLVLRPDPSRRRGRHARPDTGRGGRRDRG